MAAQARASAVQNLPAMPCYTGEEKDVMDDGLERWIEHFEERGKIACWSPEQKLYHIRRDCPRHQEAPQRSANLNIVGARADTGSVKDLSEEELEHLLTDKRLAPEKGLLSESESSKANTVLSSDTCARAVGSTLEMEVSIEDVPLVDTRAQSTIISRTTLHAIAQHLKQGGCPPPTLGEADGQAIWES